MIQFSYKRAYFDGNRVSYNSREVYENTLAFNLLFPIHAFIPVAVKKTFEASIATYSIKPSEKLLLSSAIENEITQCKRTVYADTTEEVDREFAYLSKHYPSIEFFKSKEHFLRMQRYWQFPDATIDTKLYYQVHQMIAAGIYAHLENIFLSSGLSPRVNYTLQNQPEKNTGRNDPQAVSLQDRIQSCFYMYLIFIGACLTSFGLEIVKTNRIFRLDSGLVKSCFYWFCSRLKWKFVFMLLNLTRLQRLLIKAIKSLA